MKGWSGTKERVSNSHSILSVILKPPLAIETLPPNRSAVFRHLSDPHNLVGLFPHSTSTRKFPVRNRADHGEAVTDKKFRCETRTSLDIDDDGWVEIPYCGAVLTGKENYRRHLKSVHLRMPRIAKASLSLSEWAESRWLRFGL